MTTNVNRQPFHSVTAGDALKALGASPQGLNAEEAARRLEKHGENRLPESPRRSPFMRLLAQFHNILIYVLLASAAVTAALLHVVDTAVIVAVVIVNASCLQCR